MLPVVRIIVLLTANLVLLSCTNEKNKNMDGEKDIKKGSYGYDAELLKKHTAEVLELYDETRESKVLLSAEYQGRVMTSTTSGDTGLSYGWLNYDLISSGEIKPHINPVGGEER